MNEEKLPEIMDDLDDSSEDQMAKEKEKTIFQSPQSLLQQFGNSSEGQAALNSTIPPRIEETLNSSNELQESQQMDEEISEQQNTAKLAHCFSQQNLETNKDCKSGQDKPSTARLEIEVQKKLLLRDYKQKYSQVGKGLSETEYNNFLLLVSDQNIIASLNKLNLNN